MKVVKGEKYVDNLRVNISLCKDIEKYWEHDKITVDAANEWRKELEIELEKINDGNNE